MRLIRIATLIVLCFLAVKEIKPQEHSPSNPNRPPAAADYDPKNWKEFKSAEGGFSILLPGTPSKSASTVDSASGPVAVHYFLLETALGAYYVSYADFPKPPTTPEEVKAALDSSRNNVLARAKLLSENEFPAFGTMGRELIVENQQSIVRARFFVKDGRLYQALLGVPAAVAFRSGKASTEPLERTEAYETLSTRFFDSFKLVAPSSSTRTP